MDYLELILKGYTNENDRKFLNNFFIRESKKAQKHYYNLEEFFAGLLNAIETLKKEYENPFYKRKNELYLLQDGAENDTLKYGDLEIESIAERHKKTIEYCNSELSQITFENYPINLLHLTNDRYRGNLLHSEVLFIESEIEQAFKEVNKPKQNKTNKKNTLTNDTYYTILESCTIEAFECLTVKDLYPQDGSKAIWDTSSLTISTGNGLPTERDKELFTKEYIKDNMRTTFLRAIERHSEKFQKKHSITRSVFYKKCYQSLLFKISESPLWKKPDFGIDINNPCVLTFIWNMRSDIEARSIETKQTELTPPDLFDTSTVKNTIPAIKEPYGEMFANNGFELFEYILDEYIKSKNITGRYEDLSYYYRCLFEDKFIHQKPEPFRLWFIEKYTDDFSKIKTKTQTTSPQRKKDYTAALDWFDNQRW